MRKKAVWLCFFGGAAGVLLLAAGLNIKSSLGERATALEEYNNQTVQAKDKTKNVENVLSAIDAARTNEAWAEARSAVMPFPDSVRSLLLQIVGGKEMESRFYAQERLLLRARALLEANEKDLVAGKYIKEAEQLHKKNMDVINKVKEISGNCEWSYALHYLKGLLYYRGLVFVNPEDTANAKNLIDQSLESFVKALVCAPKERDDEVAIELLYQKAKGAGLLNKGDRNMGALRLGVLPMPDSGPDGPGTGGRGREDGRH